MYHARRRSRQLASLIDRCAEVGIVRFGGAGGRPRYSAPRTSGRAPRIASQARASASLSSRHGMPDMNAYALASSSITPADEQQSRVEAMQLLVQTLLTTQHLVPPHALRETNSLRDGPDWLRYFANLGVSTTMVALMPTTARATAPSTIDLATELDQMDWAAEQQHQTEQDSETRDKQIRIENVDEVNDAGDRMTRKLAYYKRRLEYALKHGTPHTAMHVCYQVKNSDMMDVMLDLHYDVVKAVFFMTGHSRPLDAQYLFDILTSKGDVEHEVYVAMLHHLCHAISLLNPEIHPMKSIQLMCRNVVAKVQKLDRPGQERCMPTLTSSLCQQRAQAPGQFAARLYQYMESHEFDLSGSYLEHLMSLTRYYRQDDLPYAAILSRAVLQAQHRPSSFCVAHVLENLFPFANMHDAQLVLQAVLHLIRTTPEHASYAERYRLDMACLEVVGASAAQQGAHAVMMTIWDLVDALQHGPTPGLYESTAVAFAKSPETYSNAWIVIGDMVAKEMELTRALVRNFSTCIRYDEAHIERALHDLVQLAQTNVVALHTNCLNVILSGWAERGDAEQALRVLETYYSMSDGDSGSVSDTPRVVPNDDTFSFALEALGKNIARKTRMASRSESAISPGLLRFSLNQADMLLTHMEQMEVVPSHHVIREYVELLCLAGEVQTATDVVLETLRCSGDQVSSKAVYRVAMANLEAGNATLARQLSEHVGEAQTVLLHAIDDREQRLMQEG